MVRIMVPLVIVCKVSDALRQVDMHMRRPTPGGKSRSVGGLWVVSIRLNLRGGAVCGG